MHDRTLGWQEPRLAQSSLDSSESSLRILASNSERCTGLPPVSPSTALSKVVNLTESGSSTALPCFSLYRTTNQAISQLDTSLTSSILPNELKNGRSTTTAIFFPHLRSVGTLICS